MNRLLTVSLLFFWFAATSFASITETLPVADEPNAPKNTSIKIVFSEPMDTASVQDNFKLKIQKKPVTTKWLHDTVYYNEGSYTFTFKPATPLAPGTYQASMSKKVKNAAGASVLSSDYKWDFTIGDYLVPELASIALSSSASSVHIGQSVDLSVIGTYSDASTKNLASDVQWVLSDTSLASIDASGVLHANVEGTLSIEARLNGVTSNIITIDIINAVEQIALSPSTLNIAYGSSDILQAIGTFSDQSTQDITSQVAYTVSDPSVVSIDSSGVITTLKSGTITVTANLDGITSNSSSITVYPVLQQINLEPASLNMPLGTTATLIASGVYNDGTSTDISDAVTYAVSDPFIASISSLGSITALAEGNATVTAELNGIVSNETVIAVYVDDVDTSNLPKNSFGDTYKGAIASNATLDQYDEARFCVINGAVQDQSGAPLGGVNVSIKHNSEYGSVITDTHGRFEIAVEGGRLLTVVYQKDGFTTAHRQVEAPWKDIVTAATPTMLPHDSKFTAISLTSVLPQTHISTPVIDDRGQRSTTLVFNGVTGATATYEDGTQKVLDAITVRATEFETPASMPANLPVQSAFTYCSDLIVDEAGDGAHVEFDKPVVMYVDNFLGFNVGEIVPVGYYDRQKAQWVPSENGLVVKLLDTDADGIVDALDSDGDDIPDDLNGNGNLSDEVEGLGDNTLYSAGATFWRSEITHFTPWDCNWPYGPPPGAESPKNPDPTDATPDTPDESTCLNSYVENKKQVFHEDISIPGTQIRLHYASNRAAGYSHKITIPASGDAVPSPLEGIIVRMEVAGKTYETKLPAAPNQSAEFIWDGKDYNNNPVAYSVTAKISVGYEYTMTYYSSRADFSRAFGSVGSGSTFIRGRTNMISWQRFEKALPTNSGEIANGWALSNHHRLLDNKTLQKGDGQQITTNAQSLIMIDTVAENGAIDVVADSKSNVYFVQGNQIKKLDKNGVITVYAGTGQTGFSGDGGPAVNASFKSLYGLGIDHSDNIYIMDLNFRIRKIDAKSTIITTIAGNGVAGFSGDGGPAKEAMINYSRYTYSTSAMSHDVAVDPSGNVYFADYKNQRIRKISPDGIIMTVAGNGQIGFSGDGGSALNAQLNNPTDVALDKEGNLYFADWDNGRIRKVDTQGIITTVAGGGASKGSGIPATEVALTHPYGIAVDKNGNLLIADEYYHVIRRVDTRGISTILAGTGVSGFSGDGGMAEKARISYPYDLDIDAEGNVLIADTSNKRVRKIFVNPLLKKYGLYLDERLVADPNGLAYIFDTSGKHLQTLDYSSAAVLTTFSYDANDKLIAITDRFGNETVITYDASVASTITSPYGHSVQLGVDNNNDLASVTYEDGSSYNFTYVDGLMLQVQKPNSSVFTHEFDAYGHITLVQDPEGGQWTLASNTNNDGSTLYSIASVEGDQKTYLESNDISGFLELSTNAAGDQIQYEKTKDGMSEQQTECSMVTNTTHAIDSHSKQKRLASISQKTPSGLNSLTSYTKTYAYSAEEIQGITETVTQNGKITSAETDYVNGTTILTSPQGRIINRQFDIATLQPVSIEISGLLPVYYTHDAQGRLISENTGIRQRTYAYNPRGQIATYTSPLGLSTFYEYDLLDRITKEIRPDESEVHYSYDASGNMTLLRVPTPADHTFGYNSVGKRTAYTTPLSKTTAYLYDRDRRLKNINLPSGASVSYSYSDGNLASVTRAEGTLNYTYACGGNIATATASNGESIAYGYDGTLLTQMTYSGQLNQSIGYTYNNDFLPSSITYAGAVQTLAYDNDGLLITNGSAAIARDTLNGLPTGVTDSTFALSRTFNGYGEVDSESTAISTLGTYEYAITERYPNGQIKTKTDTVNGVTTTYGYSYDTMNRLVEVAENGTVSETYAYDANGNRILSTTPRGTFSANYTVEDQLEQVGDTIYAYNEDGYLSSKIATEGTTHYNYGTLGELRSVTLPDGTIIEYLHNADNQRIAKKVNGVITEKYLWEDLTTLLAVYDGSDNLKIRFSYADARMPHKMSYEGTTYYLSYDQVGSLRAVSDTAGSVVKEVTYDTFGNILEETNSAMKLPFGFAGGLYDEDTQLTRFGYRDYDAYTGKWTAKDPIGFNGGDTNLYGYVLGDPVNFVDPEGLMTKKQLNKATDKMIKESYCLAVRNGGRCEDVLNIGYPGCGGNQNCQLTHRQYFTECMTDRLDCGTEECKQ